MPFGLELPRRRPSRPARAEAHQLRPDAFIRPVAARRIRLLDEDVAGGTSGADPLEHSGFDELREVVGCLRSAHPREFLISATSQF
jgi:hypothetical protein